MTACKRPSIDIAHDMFSATLLGCAAAGLALLVRAVAEAPSQVHLALAGQEAVRVMWFTTEESLDAACQYGSLADAMDMSASGKGNKNVCCDVRVCHLTSPCICAAADSMSYLAGWGFHHRALMAGLRQGQVYYYSCGDSSGSSETFRFKTPPPAQDSAPPYSATWAGRIARRAPWGSWATPPWRETGRLPTPGTPWRAGC